METAATVAQIVMAACGVIGLMMLPRVVMQLIAPRVVQLSQEDRNLLSTPRRRKTKTSAE